MLRTQRELPSGQTGGEVTEWQRVNAPAAPSLRHFATLRRGTRA